MAKFSDVMLLNMCMIENEKTKEVVVLDKIGSRWSGLNFPGGHVEPFESMGESTVREVKEETGLDVKDLRLRGIAHWCDKKTSQRWMIFLYKTTMFSGALIGETDEGKVSWMTLSEMKKGRLAPDLLTFLSILEKDEYSESFSLSSDLESDELYLL